MAIRILLKSPGHKNWSIFYIFRWLVGGEKPPTNHRLLLNTFCHHTISAQCLRFFRIELVQQLAELVFPDIVQGFEGCF